MNAFLLSRHTPNRLMLVFFFFHFLFVDLRKMEIFSNCESDTLRLPMGKCYSKMNSISPEKMQALIQCEQIYLNWNIEPSTYYYIGFHTTGRVNLRIRVQSIAIRLNWFNNFFFKWSEKNNDDFNFKTVKYGWWDAFDERKKSQAHKETYHLFTFLKCPLFIWVKKFQSSTETFSETNDKRIDFWLKFKIDTQSNFGCYSMVESQCKISSKSNWNEH